MRRVLLAILLFSNFAFAQDAPAQKPEDNSKKMTTKDAKKACKDEGKTGPDLIKCMKEKKGEK